MSAGYTYNYSIYTNFVMCYSICSTNLDYVLSNPPPFTLEHVVDVGVDDECSSSKWTNKGSRETLPDYVKQAKSSNQQIELFLAITSETAYGDCVKYKGYHYCNCRQVLMKTGSTLANVLEAVCPACRKMIDIKQTIRKGNETTKNADNELPLPSGNSENRRSSTSDNSVDSGYSPDAPMTP